MLHVRSHASPARPRRAFTLIEILVVVIVLGVLAAIAVAGVSIAKSDAEQVVFINSMKTFAQAAQKYMLDTGEYLEDSSSGEVPGGFDSYIVVNNWTGGTPIGGVWDFELDSYGIISGFGVHFNDGSSPGDAYMQEIDARFDDGDLSTGGFQKITNDRYYFILEDD